MRIDNERLRAALAAEYVLGTLRGRARRRFERWLAYSAATRAQVAAWERWLAVLLETVSPVDPPARVWRAIARRLDPDRSRLHFWRRLAFLATAAASVLATVVVHDVVTPPATRYVAVLHDAGGRAAWVVSSAEAKGAITVSALTPAPPGPQQALELWLIPEGSQTPRSLGLLQHIGRITMNLERELIVALRSGSMFAVSLEPAGGSPTGSPTGPVLYQGAWLPLS